MLLWCFGWLPRVFCMLLGCFDVDKVLRIAARALFAKEFVECYGCCFGVSNGYQSVRHIGRVF